MEINGQYLTYQEYQALDGTLSEMPFKILEFEARQNIDKYTFGRLKTLDSQIQETKLCVYKLLEVIGSYDSYESHNKDVSSENTDGYSVTYNTPNSAFIESKNNEIKSVIKDYLIDCKLDDGTPYMYCGVDK